ncbi:MAG: DUF3368 domain-containing protein [Oscillospiraceae bacterium]|nr:DUF3368 domain-containing protein [Oscillospiraceae bacterium]
MDKPVVAVNSTPIILLQKIGRLNLLQKLYSEVYIPKAVYKEVIIDGIEKISGQEDFLMINNWINVVDIQNENAKKMFATNLHAGEVETIILAMERTVDLCILDDLLARKYAVKFNLNVTGTLGVLIAAKKQGYIKSVKPLLDMLVSVGIYVSEELYNNVALLAGE